ncbi:MAG: 23S rRNA (adenine(2030)-N(6))-methyltransferase RlmJ [Pseudomonadales bacterium]|nr:23S rRNA (adenine(2030)-N(6))-methyltransferase RlmJ [Pseudomonadales bacterium]MCP5185277.1 23S rRNA (adenine(2030)-N(6))-methyltransferase RlmJ [Pseudomonadales bacterium]
MLSYQHGYHAGNHADVLKHLVLMRVLSHLNRKPRPWTYLDTHSGRGLYALDSAMARKTGEAEQGIQRLRELASAPEILSDYLTLTARPDGRYTGSPAIALALAREDDRLILCERHPTEYRALKEAMQSLPHKARIRCLAEDGYQALRASLPPTSRRGAILIDPSYETDADFAAVAGALAEGLRRFGTGVFMVWYPCLDTRQARELPQRLRRLANGPWLDARLNLSNVIFKGLAGSGVFVANPPWTLHNDLDTAMPVLAHCLGGDEQAGIVLESGD